jgi:hypothetical protein
VQIFQALKNLLILINVQNDRSRLPVPQNDLRSLPS